jgi:hypothetical protein
MGKQGTFNTQNRTDSFAKKKEQTAWAGYDYTNQTVRNPVTAQQIKSEPNIVSGYIL